jgi:Zn-dependent protease
MNSDFVELGGKVLSVFVPFLFALSFHEYAHGWMAKRKGDNTAESMGRLTMNPFAHADPIGTFALPLIGLVSGMAMFGWAKPVPVDPRNFRDPKNDMFWVAAAGPLSNLFLAILGCLLFIGVERFYPVEGGVANYIDAQTLGQFLFGFIFINMLLCLFNLIPLHPLDGGKILERFIPYSWNRALEENQGTLNVILIVAFVMGGFSFLGQFAHRMIMFFLVSLS